MHKRCDTFNLIIRRHAVLSSKRVVFAFTLRFSELFRHDDVVRDVIIEERRKRERTLSRAKFIFMSIRVWENKTILIHLVDDRKHQVDRMQRTKDAYNRESTSWLARVRRDLSFERENAMLFLWVTWDSPSRLCRGNLKEIEFSPIPSKRPSSNAFVVRVFPLRIRRNFLTFAVSNATMQRLLRRKTREERKKNYRMKMKSDKLPEFQQLLKTAIFLTLLLQKVSFNFMKLSKIFCITTPYKNNKN